MNTEIPPLRWLVLDLNSFFASCEQQDNPHLRQKPIIIVPMLAESTCAIAASYEAKNKGIKTGTPVYQARQLCPNLILVPARPKRYVEFHHKILEAIETCAPIEDVMSIDEVACRLDRTQQTPEKACALGQAMKNAICEKVGSCLTSSVGIASNKLLAKLASDMQKPDGLTVLSPSLMPEPILGLKIQDICGIGPNMALRLENAGILTIPDLWNANAFHLKKIWGGVMGLRFHALLHGADLPSPPRPRHSMGHEHVLAPAQRRMDLALPVIRQLLVKAAARLRTEKFYTRRLIVHIKWNNDAGYWINEQRFHETQDTQTLLKTLMNLWAKAPHFTPLRIGIVLGDLAPQGAHQGDLFEKRIDKTLTNAIDALNAKFGRGTVSFGETEKDLATKISFQRVPKMNEFS